MASYPDSANPNDSTAARPDARLGQQVADKAQQAIGRTAENAHAVVDRLANKAGPAVDQLRAGVNSATAALHSGVDEFDEYQERWVGNCRSYVREHPLASVGIAVAAGMLLSRLLAR